MPKSSSGNTIIQNLPELVNENIPLEVTAIHVLVVKRKVQQKGEQPIISYGYVFGIENIERILLNTNVILKVVFNLDVVFPENVSIYVAYDYTVLVDSDQLSQSERDNLAEKIGDKIIKKLGK